MHYTCRTGNIFPAALNSASQSINYTKHLNVMGDLEEGLRSARDDHLLNQILISFPGKFGALGLLE
jgi:hypothetical protein